MEYELKAGLEIHQQLNTNKLFCPCPSILRNDKPLQIFTRRLNPVAGETGKIDIAAEFESSKDKKFKYYFYDTNCLVELDEEPPHDINKEALKIALQIALLLNCKIFPITQVMRKTVIDGSNTSGFQRTVLIGYDGYVETSMGKVGIDTIALEEDSARIISEKENEKIFSLDRLGIPLVEITTKPDLKTPQHIKETALKIGGIIRSTNVKRGLGTIRQDLNISIKGSKRTEIKGFQDPKIMIKTVENEIKRQKKCIEENSCKPEVRKVTPDGKTVFLRPVPTEARMYPETDIPILKISRELVNEVKKSLPKLVSENKKYLKEFGINDDLIRLILRRGKLEEFKSLVKIYDNPLLVAKMLTLYPKEIARKNNLGLDEVYSVLSEDLLEKVLEKVDKEISPEDVKLIMERLVKKVPFEEAIKKHSINLEEEIKKIISEKPNLSFNAYMGLLMGKLRGRISGSEVSKVLKKFVNGS